MVLNAMLIGLGDIAMRYDQDVDDMTWTHLKALTKDDRFNVYAGVDVNIEILQEFEDKTGALIFSNLEEALEETQKKIDIYVISTPTHCHYKQYKLIKSKVKDISNKIILLEKPITNDIKQLDEILYDFELGQKIMVNLIRLYQKQVNNYLERFSKSGNCSILVTYSKGLLHNGIHFFTLISRSFGKCISWRNIKLGSFTCHEFKFENSTAIFKPSYESLDDNSMIVSSNLGSLYYLYGGRHSFFVDANLRKIDFNEEEFNHYQKYVYDSVYDEYSSNQDISDPSFDLAVKAQRILYEVQTNS